MARSGSGTCRVAAHRASGGRAAAGLPVEMGRLRRWVRYSSTKVSLTTEGWPASSTDPATWSTLAETDASTWGCGLGFVLAGDGALMRPVNSRRGPGN
ncbi:hypothetical protein [Embleya hyalina]|nr:hypothetical protein [Embleya hyalina]